MNFMPTETDFHEVFKEILDTMVKESTWSRILYQQIWDAERNEEGSFEGPSID